jgi:hypothetical protein
MRYCQRVDVAVAVCFGLAFAVIGWRDIAGEIVSALW